MFPVQKKQEEPEPKPVATKPAVDEVREYRIEQFDRLRFTPKEAIELADATDSKGFSVSWHAVRRALDAGCTHKQAVWIFTRED